MLALDGMTPGLAQNVTPPDLSVCDGVDACHPPTSLCSAAGFKISLTNYTPAPAANSGSATYTYQICSPAAGVCTGDNTTPCLDNEKCTKGGNPPGGTCTRECAADSFRGLSHFDVTFPELGASCLGAATKVNGTCSNGDFVLGDGSCFSGGTSHNMVAKCDNTNLQPGDCLTMTVSIPGELNKPGLGAAVVVDKEATTCTASCLAGPSCEDRGGPPTGSQCLTRTIGFWGTHLWITNDYDPVTVCGKPLGCSGASDGKSDPSCLAGSCGSIMEGLGSVGGESPKDSAHVAMVKQLTAAKLNLNATAALVLGAGCADFRYGGKTIQEWITSCEALCDANQATISGSGCVEALNAFNNSQDTGFAQTPAPFDRPPVDDFGNVSGADPSGFTAAQGNSTPPGKWVIGKKVGNNDCR